MELSNVMLIIIITGTHTKNLIVVLATLYNTFWEQNHERKKAVEKKEEKEEEKFNFPETCRKFRKKKWS